MHSLTDWCFSEGAALLTTGYMHLIHLSPVKALPDDVLKPLKYKGDDVQQPAQVTFNIVAPARRGGAGILAGTIQQPADGGDQRVDGGN